MKFHVDALHSFKVILRTKKGRTDRRADGLTDGRVDYYMRPLAGIKIEFTSNNAFNQTSFHVEGHCDLDLKLSKFKIPRVIYFPQTASPPCM